MMKKPQRILSAIGFATLLAVHPLAAGTSPADAAPSTTEVWGSLGYALTTPEGDPTDTAEAGIRALPVEPVVEADELVAILTTPIDAAGTGDAVTEIHDSAAATVHGGAGHPDADRDGELPVGEPDLAASTSADDLLVLTEVLEPGEFAVAALTWPAGGDDEGISMNLRVRERGEWTAWLSIEADDAGIEDEARSGTDPFLTGMADAIQVQINGNGASLPADLKLEVFMLPEFSGPAPMAGGASVPSAVGPSAVPGDPGVIVRERWGAEPATPKWSPQLVRLQGAVVHHTAGTNNYQAQDSARLVRNIHYYHAVTRGWGDIGYNFLVDKYGQIFEGRDRSYDAPWSHMSIGAHAAPRNTHTLGVSIMGDYTEVVPTAASLDSVVKVIQWRFNAAGLDGRTSWTFPATGSTPAATLPRIMGHRDVSATLCPGPHIYAWLPTLREKVGALPRNWSSFTDVSANVSAFVAEINWMKAAGISTGWSDNTFRPQQSATRAEFAAFMYRFAGSPHFDAPGTPPFPDVPKTHPFYRQIAWLVSTGITTGWPDGTFGPDRPVMRDQVAAFLYRYNKAKHTGSPTSPFTDVPTGYVFYNEISWLASNRITTGWSDGTFRPQQPVNREQIAAFMFRYGQKF